MIRKRDILERAGEWRLRAEVVEKDYVLGWVLAGFARPEVTSTSWVLKGGTCLKKCYFETYRFSEDLDFSLLPDAAYDSDSLLAALREVARRTEESSGILLPADDVVLRERRDKQGRPTFEGRLAYRGPLVMPNWPRIRLDITRHEPLQMAAALRPVFHPYPDELPGEALVPCYALEELLAEKTRALVERTRSRDLYDVVHIGENLAHDVDPTTARECFERKCRVKGFPAPSRAEITTLARGSVELRSEWEHMLAHQLPHLPAVDAQLERLEAALFWLDPEPTAPVELPVVEAPRTELAAPRGPRFWGIADASLELVRFAAAQRLRVAFTYQGRQRIAEPYSLRRRGTGNLLLFAWEDGATSIKSYKVRELRSVEVTNQHFTPRYRIELGGR